MYFDSNQQLLIYVKSEERIGKNRVIKGIEIGFTLFIKRKKLVISMPNKSAVNDICLSMVYTVLGVNN